MVEHYTNELMAGLIRSILLLAAVFLAGVLSTFLYNRLMIPVGQGVLKKVRDQMFDKMEQLPIRYFDVNAHGDIMSRYTNDTDTMRQMIGQTIPQLMNSIMVQVPLPFGQQTMLLILLRNSLTSSSQIRALTTQ